jgi:FkbM family methyltransferase
MRLTTVSGHTVYLPLLRGRGPTVLDLGGNRGAFSSWAATALEAKVHVVEALPELAEALSSDSRLTVMHAAVGPETGTTTIFRSPDRCASVSLNAREPANAVLIPAVTLEDLCRQWSLADLDLLKMDIEGSELDVLEKAPIHLLQSVGQITCEFHDFIDASHLPAIRRICERMKAAGFLVFPIAMTTYGDTLFINRNRLGFPALTAVECMAYKYWAAMRRLLRRCCP